MLTEQERALENERVRERLESSLGLICGDMARTFSDWQKRLAGFADGKSVEAPAGAVIVVLDDSGSTRHMGAPLLFQPTCLPDAPADAFAAAEILEIREGNLAKASALYRDLARSTDRHVKAGALMRLARCLRNGGRIAEALNVYAELAEVGDVPVAGAPVALLSLRERSVLYQVLGNDDSKAREQRLLAAALRQGAFRIDRATYEFFRECLPDQGVSAEEASGRALAEAVASVYASWLAAPDALPGRLVLAAGGTSFAAVLRKTKGNIAALITPCSELMASLEGSQRSAIMRVQLLDSQGQLIWGENAGGDIPAVMKTSLETGLPWSVRATSADGAAEGAMALSRRRLLLGAVTLIALALAAAGYAIFRAVTREMRVARLQSDFVAAVSHEFRTPLAAMCHLTESLDDGRVDDTRRSFYYRALAKESRRLKEMVESLLDFARMESGRQVYRKEELELASLIRGVVESFQEEHADHGRRIDLELPAEECRIRGDAEALARALRNLLDNAAKYSPASSAIRVSLSRDRQRVAIAVGDQGAGITKAEQREIFRKFVRGSSARSLNVKGTGLGLAMVRHIVAGHGGKIVVASEPGRGSRFTIELPKSVTEMA